MKIQKTSIQLLEGYMKEQAFNTGGLRYLQMSRGRYCGKLGAKEWASPRRDGSSNDTWV